MTRKYSSLAGRWPWKSESAKVCVNNSPAEKRKKRKRKYNYFWKGRKINKFLHYLYNLIYSLQQPQQQGFVTEKNIF